MLMCSDIVLLICTKFGAPDIDPFHVVILREVAILSHKSGGIHYLEGRECRLSRAPRIIY